MAPSPFTVLAKRQDTVDTWTLELAARDGAVLAFEPGQFTMISAGGCGEVPISISGDPARADLLVHTVRAVGLATRAICAAEPGEVLSVRGPFGRPWPVTATAGADVVVVAGGIGLAPLRPAILALLDPPPAPRHGGLPGAGDRERRGSLTLLYGGRAPDQLLYEDELARWRGRGLAVDVTVDSAGPEWLGHVGVVTRLIARAELDPERLVALLCGPEIMMRFAVAALVERGLAADRIHVSMERNMQCGIGHCGHCQLGPTLVCRDGPVYRWSELERWLAIREL
jgi:NAD(P)H-flavin reductase